MLNQYYISPRSLANCEEDKPAIVRVISVINKFCLSNKEINIICNPEEVLDEALQQNPKKATEYQNTGMMNAYVSGTASEIHSEVVGI